MTTGPKASRRNIKGSAPSRKHSSKPRLHLLKHEGKIPGEALKKIAILQLEAAIAGLERNAAAPEAIHDARTFIKKVRAIVRLASPAFPELERRKLDAELRSTSGKMGPLRDADVHLNTLDRLFSSRGPNLECLASVRAGLLKLASLRRRTATPRIGMVISSLRNATNEIRSTPLAPLHSGDLEKRIRRTYRRGRHSLEQCEQSRDPEHFHAWRKEVKRLWYQLRLTARFWPENAASLIRQAGAIGELAGRERDLTLLKDTLGKGKGSDGSRDVISIIEEELPGLRADAIRKGKALYGARPRTFVKKLKL